VQVELKELQRRLGITFIYVTHDQEEALTMSDRVAVMNAGRLEQVDGAAPLFERPRTEFVARFLGAGNFFRARVRPAGAGRLALALADGVDFEVEAPSGRPRRDGQVSFIVRPERLTLRGRDLTARGVPSLPVTIDERIFQGASTAWRVSDARGERYVVHEPSARPFSERRELAPGGRGFLCFRPRHAVLLADEGGG